MKGVHCEGIFYDQGGTGDSSIPSNKNLSEDYSFLLDISDLRGEELHAVIDATVKSEDNGRKVSFGWRFCWKHGCPTICCIYYNVNTERNSHIESIVLNGPIRNTKKYFERIWDPIHSQERICGRGS